MYISYFKSPEVFNDPSLRNEVCYIPENVSGDDDFYTHNDFLVLCGGKEDLAAQLFDSVDWQHPEVVIDENLRYGLWAVCPRCGNLYDTHDQPEVFCPECNISFSVDIDVPL